MRPHAIFLLSLLLLSSAAAAAPSPYRFDAPARVVAFGDVHGAYDALEKTLRAAGVIDAQGKWTGGNAHLVSVGDLLDRGPGSRQAMELLMRLEGEAQAAGGRVHVVMGNHEVMNLTRELRDASAAEFAAFARDETAEERAQALQAFLARKAGSADEAALRAEFDRRFPPGWFAHRREFGREGRYGRWLLARPVAIAVGDTLFAHGGFSRALSGYDLDRLNREFHAGLDSYLEAAETLERGGWLSFDMPGESWAGALAPRLAVADPPPDPALAAAARVVLGIETAPLFGIRGPVWYRGLAMCRGVTEQDVADEMQAQFGVSRLAVGHTVTPRLRPTSRLGGDVLMLDTGMLHAVYRGKGHAVEIDAGGVRAIDEDGKRIEILADDRLSGLAVPGSTDAVLESALLAATVAKRTPQEGAREAVTLDYKGTPLQAWFFPSRRGGAHARELAAYRLDRLLGLGLVPTTVERELDGTPGALQWRPDNIVGAAQAAAGARGGTAWCETNPELELLYVWDSLLLNKGRTPETLHWAADDWFLLASDHRNAFGTGQGPPPHLKEHALKVGPELCRRLKALDAASLEKSLADAASKKEKSALLKRRDGIVKKARCA